MIWYWDTSFGDNDVGLHPGQGEILPIDAHPQPIHNLQGQPWRGRIALYDATFTPQKADSFTLHVNGQASYVRGQAGQRVFDDSRQHWYPETPRHRNPGAVDQRLTGMRVTRSTILAVVAALLAAATAAGCDTTREAGPMPESQAPRESASPPLSSTELPTRTPPAKPPKTPSDLMPTNLAAGRVTRGGSGPC